MKQALTDALPRPLFVRDSRQLCAGNGGRPLYLRAVELLEGGVIRCVDGGGEAFLYRVRRLAE